MIRPACPHENSLVEDEKEAPSVDPPTFEELGVSAELRAAIEALGWEQPTPIQVKSIPTGLAGTDLVGIAQTGTGKTGAFMLPALERIETGGGLQVLVLCPTRELAQQVCDDTEELSKGTRIRAASIYGGVAYDPQLKALKEGFEVITATPGRFLAHLGRGRVNLKNVRTLPPADRGCIAGSPQEPTDDALLGHHASRRA